MFAEIETLERIEQDLNEAIEYVRLGDHSYRREFTLLVRRRRIIRRAIRKLKRLG